MNLHLSYALDWKALLGLVSGHRDALLAGIRVDPDIDLKSLRYRLATVLPGRGYRKLPFAHDRLPR